MGEHRWEVEEEGTSDGQMFSVYDGCGLRITDPSISKYDAEKVARALSRDALFDEMVAALESVQALISEAASTGFNYKDGDWPERLFFSQRRTSAVLSKVREASK